MMDFPLTVTTILRRAQRLFPRVEILSRLPDRSLHRSNFGQVTRRALALGEMLTRSGMRRGDRVATLMWNHYAHLEAYLGIPVAGGVVHTLNPRLHPDELAYIITHAEDRFLIVDDVLLHVWEKLKDRVRLERVWVVPLKSEPVPAGCDDYEQLLAQATGDFVPPALNEYEAAAMCYTSGTTGRPKGVVYTHRAQVLHTFCISLPEVFGGGHKDVVLPVVPMFHANGWGLPYSVAMNGNKVVYPGPYLDPESLLDLFEREQVTYAAGVPTVWLGILEALEKNPGRWKLASGLRLTCGGAAAPEGMIRRFDALGVQIIHSWGMTETTPAGSTSYLTAC